MRDTEDWELLPTTRIVRDEPRIAMWFGVLALIAWFCVAGALISEAMIAVAFGAMFSVLAACSIAVVVVLVRRPVLGQLGGHVPRVGVPDQVRRPEAPGDRL